MVKCEAPTGHSVCDSDLNPFHTLGLDCGASPTDSIALESEVFAPSDASSWRSVREYGNPTFTRTEGNNLLAFSTGQLPMAVMGVVTVPPEQTDMAGTNNANPDNTQLPAPIDPSSGTADGTPFGACDDVGDCSESLPGPWDAGGPANDLVFLSFDVTVPEGVYAYQVDLAWFSTEFPLRSTVTGTDLAVWWQSSEAFTGNMATLEGQPLSADGLAPWLVDQGLLGGRDDVELMGTGFEGSSGLPCNSGAGTLDDCPHGASTGWLTMTGPVVGGETATMVLTVFDLFDNIRDTTLLADSFRWRCEGCQPGSTCGLGPLEATEFP